MAAKTVRGRRVAAGREALRVAQFIEGYYSTPSDTWRERWPEYIKAYEAALAGYSGADSRDVVLDLCFRPLLRAAVAMAEDSSQ